LQFASERANVQPIPLSSDFKSRPTEKLLVKIPEIVRRCFQIELDQRGYFVYRSLELALL